MTAPEKSNGPGDPSSCKLMPFVSFLIPFLLLSGLTWWGLEQICGCLTPRKHCPHRKVGGLPVFYRQIKATCVLGNPQLQGWRQAGRGGKSERRERDSPKVLSRKREFKAPKQVSFLSFTHSLKKKKNLFTLCSVIGTVLSGYRGGQDIQDSRS